MPDIRTEFDSATGLHEWRCPKCFGLSRDVNTGNLARKVGKHKESQVCKEMSARLVEALAYAEEKRVEGAVAEAPLQEAHRIHGGTNVIIADDPDSAGEVLPEEIIFEAPAASELCVELKRSRRIYAPDGTEIDYIPAIYAFFHNNRFATRDAYTVRLMRRFKFNMANLTNPDASRHVKARFFEVDYTAKRKSA